MTTFNKNSGLMSNSFYNYEYALRKAHIIRLKQEVALVVTIKIKLQQKELSQQALTDGIGNRNQR